MRRQQSQGFSLVELMISMALSLFLMLGVMYLFISTNKSWALNDELARMQENARLTFDILGRYIRSASYTGCPAQVSVANALAADSIDREWMAHFDKGIFGFTAGSETQQRVDSLALSEALVVHSLDMGQGFVVLSHSTDASCLLYTSPSPRDS